MPAKTLSRPIDQNEYRILTYCEQFFLQYGRLPNTGDIVEAGYSKQAFHVCLKLPQFQLGLEQRGIVPYALLNSNGKIPEGLTSEQLVAANTMLDLIDNRSQKKKLQDLEITSQTWNAWLRNPRFNAYLRARSEALLKDSIHDSHLALVDRVKSGDINAIKYMNEITGRFVPAQTKGVDLHEVLFKVLEIIQQCVTDPNVQALIAGKLMEIAEPHVARLDGQPVIAKEFKEIAGVDTSPNFEVNESVEFETQELPSIATVVKMIDMQPVKDDVMSTRPSVNHDISFDF